LRIENRFSLAG